MLSEVSEEAMSINQQAYELLHENLAAVRPEFADRDVILCPICLREIPRTAVVTCGVEHIIPQNVVKSDPSDFAALGTKNQRCGITVLCRAERVCQSDRRVCKDGCNGMKGRLYDRLFQGLFETGTHVHSDFTHSHGVAILIMAYLGAFQRFGYEYILRLELDPIRTQFDFPNERKTTWLDTARYCLAEDTAQIVATSVGQPFIFGSIVTQTAPLEVMFRRCHALLPSGHRILSKMPRRLELLLPER
jgi:hypothetical protein